MSAPTAARRAAPPPRPRTWPRTLAIVLVLVAVTAITASPQWGVAFGLDGIIRNWRNGTDKIAELFQVDWTFFPRTLPPLVQTIQMAIAATAVSAVLSLPLSLLAARPTNPWTPGRLAVRAVLNVIRAVPDLLYAAILVAMVGVGALPGILALVLFDVAIIVKLVAEAIEATEGGAIEAGRAAGGTQLQIDRTMALPDVWPAFASQTLYVFELNVRVSSVLGLVGAGGTGLLIDAVRTFYRYDQLSLIILEILVVVVLIELASSAIRRRLV